MGKKFYIFQGVILFILFANVVFLNYQVFFAKKTPGNVPSEFNEINLASPSALKQTDGKVIDSCSPYSCIDLIREATASVTSKTVVTTSKPPASTPNSPKEFYVSFGSGQTMSDQYDDIAGLEVYIDSTKYGNIKTVAFEASLRIPTANGTVYAQLFNVTDKHPVWFSEVSSQSSSSQLVISAPITLDSGNKLYRIQMKTTLKYQSILDQARVHIITQ